MTLKQVIEFVDDTKPNAFTNEQKTVWINELEGRIQAQVFLWDVATLCVQYTYSEDFDPELLVGPPYDDIYREWLKAKIDEANGEYDKYQNSMAMFNAAWDEFKVWFIRTYHPADYCGGCHC